MNRLFSNGPSKDFVINPFLKFIRGAQRLRLAAPYFTRPGEIIEAAQSGKSIQLLVGLNSATCPRALASVHGKPNLAIRYLTDRFHAKIYIFDDVALLGSSNLTDGGLMANREAVVCFDQDEDIETVDEIKSLFMEMWESAQVLTPEKLRTFKDACVAIKRDGANPDSLIEKAVGRAEPMNIRVASGVQSREQIFLKDLERQVYEQYRPGFDEVTQILQENGLRRKELASIGLSNETNRFLNWVRLTHVVGDEAWRLAPMRNREDRKKEILRLGNQWVATDNSRVSDIYIEWLQNVQTIFGAKQAIENASKDTIIDGLMSLHAFTEQSRFVKGGPQNLPAAFWKANHDDFPRVKRSLSFLIHGTRNFIQRLHDLLYDPRKKLSHFGFFCALELFGTVSPDECPPMNGRMAKALRYLGFSVRGA